MSDDLIWSRPSEQTPAGPTTGHGALLRASAVTRTFTRGSEDVIALNGVDLELLRGELVALVGRSGSGKTTLLNVLCGWEKPDTGRVEWLAEPGAQVSDVEWSGIALVPQAAGLLEDLTVAENIGLPCRLKGEAAATTRLAVDEMIESLGLIGLSDRFPDEISLGEQQRASVARALVLKPDLLLADEPTAHQDAVSMARVLDAIRSIVTSGKACLVASHSSEVLDRCDRVLEMRDGRLGVAS